MCGRYAVEHPEEFAARFGLEDIPDELTPRYNAAPGQELPVIVKEDFNRLEMMTWGLVPFWAKDSKIGYKMINARAEGIENKPSYQKPIKSQRCLIPATGFYEWAKIDGIKQPYFFHRKDGEPFAFTGLFDVWEGEGKKLWSFTIITCDSNDLIKPIHHRMPVVLNKEEEAEWLDENAEISELLKLIKPDEYSGWEKYKVSTEVNIPKVDNINLVSKLKN